MIPAPKGVPVHPDYLRLQIQGGEAQLKLMRDRFEAWKELRKEEAYFWQSMAEKNGAHFAAKSFIPALKKFAEAEAMLMQLEISKVEAEVQIKKAQLEELFPSGGPSKVLLA